MWLPRLGSDPEHGHMIALSPALIDLPFFLVAMGAPVIINLVLKNPYHFAVFAGVIGGSPLACEGSEFVRGSNSLSVVVRAP